MLRLQEEKLFPYSRPDTPFIPPWRDKFFYLLDGKGKRVIAVDENPDAICFYEWDEGRPYLHPTAGPVHKVPERSRIYNDPRPVDVRKYRNGVHAALPPENRPWIVGPMANPLTITSAWQDAVLKMPKLDNPFICYSLLQKERKINLEMYRATDCWGTDEGDGDVGPTVFGLSVEIWESIVKYLDPLSFLSLSEAASVSQSSLFSTVWEAHDAVIQYNKDKDEEYWATAACRKDECMHNGRFYDVLSSYSKVVNATSRSLKTITKPTFKEIAFDEYLFQKKISDGSVTVASLSNLEERIKTELQVYYGIDSKSSWGTPIVLVDLIGSIGYFIVQPTPDTNLWVFENAINAEVRKCAIVCNEQSFKEDELRFAKVIYFPKKSETSEVERLLVTACDKCTQIQSLEESTLGVAIHHRRLSAEGSNTLDPIIVFYEDVMLLWRHPMPILFYRIVKVNGRHDVELIYKMRVVADMEYVQNRLIRYTQYFIPVLTKKTDHRFESKVRKERLEHYSEQNLTDDLYELKLISCRFGVDSISLANRCEMHIPSSDSWLGEEMGLDIVDNFQPHFLFTQTNPEYYYHNAMKYRNLLDTCYSGCYGYGVYSFWNNRAFALSFKEGIQWFFFSWMDALAPLKNELDFPDAEMSVSHMCITSCNSFAAAVQGHVIIFSCTIVEGKVLENYKQEPRFNVEPIRLVTTNLMQKELTIEQMSFSFDMGDPYIFILYRDKKTDSVLDFWMLKITFRLCGGDGDKLEEEKTSLDPQIIESYVQEARKEMSDKYDCSYVSHLLKGDNGGDLTDADILGAAGRWEDRPRILRLELDPNLLDLGPTLKKIEQQRNKKNGQQQGEAQTVRRWQYHFHPQRGRGNGQSNVKDTMRPI